MTNTDTNTETNTETHGSNLAVPLLTRLASAAGTYRGEGTNHEGESFVGDLTIGTELDGQLITIRYRASDSTNAFHEERTWITEDLIGGGLALWTVSTNTPGVLQLKLIEDTSDGSYSTQVVFRLGNPEDKSRFREQIALNLRHDKALEYVYSWGVPHQDFGVRSKCLLSKTN